MKSESVIIFIFYAGGDVILHNSILFGPYNVVELMYVSLLQRCPYRGVSHYRVQRYVLWGHIVSGDCIHNRVLQLYCRCTYATALHSYCMYSTQIVGQADM